MAGWNPRSEGRRPVGLSWDLARLRPLTWWHAFRCLGPPDDLDALDVVGDGEGLDGTESTLRDCTLHGVLGVGVPDVLCEVGKFLRALEGRDFGTEDGGEFVASGCGDLQGLLSLGEGEHGLEGCLGSILKVDVHGVQETDRTLPTVD